jgi:hypothetical protein
MVPQSPQNLRLATVHQTESLIARTALDVLQSPLTGGVAMLRRCLLAVLLATLALPLLAQKPAPPDLSGTWVLRPAKDRQTAVLSVKSRTIVIASFENNIEMRITTDGKQSLARYIADGKSRVIEGVWQELDTTKVSARWDGSSLVVQTTFSTPFNEVDRVERWTLSADGRTLTQSLDKIKSFNLVYDKQ